MVNINEVIMDALALVSHRLPHDGICRYRASGDGAFVKIGFADTGIGISEENLPRTFDLFFTTKEPGKGTVV
ncbi:MAG: hypothetical protein ACUZ77_08620 [Candidatus Brocadiales bacterium]